MNDLTLLKEPHSPSHAVDLYVKFVCFFCLLSTAQHRRKGKTRQSNEKCIPESLEAALL